MDECGVLTSFLPCKFGVVFAVATLICAVAVMSISFERTAQREELEAVLERVTDALEEIDGMPGKAWVERRLPSVGQDLELKVTGTWDRFQVVRMAAIGGESIERATLLSTEVNGGEFVLSCENPTMIRLTKDGQISVEMV